MRFSQIGRSIARFFLTGAGRKFRDRAIKQATGAIAAFAGELDLAAMRDMLPRLRAVREVLDRNR
ncbi:hypothetical protein [Desertibaculum subflavum]|uniref:hypothetical protein n=1 Tax=Desertibaculum subflavum TaxID=2268458 RepID=UPI000E66C643